jgi:hypothetical protein
VDLELNNDSAKFVLLIRQVKRETKNNAFRNLAFAERDPNKKHFGSLVEHQKQKTPDQGCASKEQLSCAVAFYHSAQAKK